MTASGHAPGGAVVVATIALTLMAGLATIGRLFTRTFIVRSFGLDDICIAAALVHSLPRVVTSCLEATTDLAAGVFRCAHYSDVRAGYVNTKHRLVFN